MKVSVSANGRASVDPTELLKLPCVREAVATITAWGAATHGYDTALIAGLQRAVRVIGAKGTVEEAAYGLMIAKSLIRAEITQLRKGAKGK